MCHNCDRISLIERLSELVEKLRAGDDLDVDDVMEAMHDARLTLTRTHNAEMLMAAAMQAQSSADLGAILAAIGQDFLAQRQSHRKN